LKIENLVYNIPMKQRGAFIANIIFSAPGIIIHEFSHELFCVLSNVKVFKVKYFQLKNPAGYVEHAQPRNFIQAFFISVGPFIFGTLLSFGLFTFVLMFIQKIYFGFLPLSIYNAILIPIALWFGFSISLGCFPSNGDAHVLLMEANRHLFQRFNPFAIFLYPFVIIIKLANGLQKFYFDYIYSIIILGLAVYTVLFLLK